MICRSGEATKKNLIGLYCKESQNLGEYMQMNPEYYYDNFVKPNYEDFCADEGNLRKAYNAIVTLCHMTDNYFAYYQRRNDTKVSRFNELKDFQIHLSSLAPYFNDVQSMANAYKHLYTNSGKAHVTVASGGAVYVEEIDENEDDIDGGDLENSCCSTVYYTKKDGNSFSAKDALSGMMDVWEDLFKA